MNAREHVQRWLGQTDAEADRYGEERAEELYCHLVDRELSKLVRQTMPKGLCTEVNPHLSQGKAVEAVTVYDRRERIANVPSLAAANARWLKSYLDRSISESGSLPDGVLLLAGLRCQNAPNPIEAALSQLSERVPKYANACKRLMDERRDGRIDDDQYYERMAGVDKAMRFDLDMSLIACEEVDLEADRYFTESGCRKAMSPEERAAGRNEQARATFATATARAEQRNTNLKTEVQNRQPVGQALTR